MNIPDFLSTYDTYIRIILILFITVWAIIALRAIREKNE